MPEPAMRAIQATLEERFELIFRKLNVTGTMDLVNRFVPREGLEGVTPGPAPSNAASKLDAHEAGE